jgi:hypothetical protein
MSYPNLLRPTWLPSMIESSMVPWLRRPWPGFLDIILERNPLSTSPPLTLIRQRSCISPVFLRVVWPTAPICVVIRPRPGFPRSNAGAKAPSSSPPIRLTPQRWCISRAGSTWSSFRVVWPMVPICVVTNLEKMWLFSPTFSWFSYTMLQPLTLLIQSIAQLFFRRIRDLFLLQVDQATRPSRWIVLPIDLAAIHLLDTVDNHYFCTYFCK